MIVHEKKIIMISLIIPPTSSGGGAKLTIKKSIEAKKRIQKHSKDFNGALSDVDCMKLIGLARNTFYKYKRELKAE